MMKNTHSYKELSILASYFLFMFYGYSTEGGLIVAATIAMCMSMIGIIFKLTTNKLTMISTISVIAVLAITGVYLGAYHIYNQYWLYNNGTLLQNMIYPGLFTVIITTAWWLAVDWCHKSVYINDNNHLFDKEHT